MKISKEVQEALKNKKAVVALESTIISHGMPYPKNVETALRVEKVIRDHGIKFFNQEYACLDPNEEITVQDEATGIVLTDKIGKIYELWQDGFLK